MINIPGLNSKQRVFCDIMWSLQDASQVRAFIATLPEHDRRECQTLVKLMILALDDEVTTVDQARDVLQQFTL